MGLIACVCAGMLGVGLWIYINLRARSLDRRDGAFRSWVRPDAHGGWTSGIGMYGVDTLSWYRLVGLRTRPLYVLPRYGLEVSAPIQRSTDGSVVEVRLTSGDQHIDIAVEPHTYNGIVSWVESGPPQTPHM